MKQKIKLLTATVALLTAFFLLSTQSIFAQVPNKVAQAMVKALKDNQRMNPYAALTGRYDSLSNDEKIAIGEKDKWQTGTWQAIDSALAITGENFSANDKFLQLLSPFKGSFLSRRPLTQKKVADYMSRFRTVGKITLDKWKTAQYNGDDSPTTPCLMLLAIVFSDFLFEGDQWKGGTPDRFLKRLGSLSKDAVSKWKLAVGNDDKAFGAYALLPVDGLFVNDNFQQSAFDAAFPIAQKLLNTK
jgi:hypothetical protein